MKVRVIHLSQFEKNPRTGENIVLINKDVKAAYHEIFDAAVAEYNA